MLLFLIERYVKLFSLFEMTVSSFVFSSSLQGEDREFIEFAPLCVTYFIVFLYLAFSVGKRKPIKC